MQNKPPAIARLEAPQLSAPDTVAGSTGPSTAASSTLLAAPARHQVEATFTCSGVVPATIARKMERARSIGVRFAASSAATRRSTYMQQTFEHSGYAADC